jgi:hypothetical protein
VKPPPDLIDVQKLVGVQQHMAKISKHVRCGCGVASRLREILADDLALSSSIVLPAFFARKSIK